MPHRSANAAIKGYFYQFDHSILRILELSTPHSSITIEGIEDVDLDNGAESLLIQCKYHEKTEYNHSVIKDAIIGMLRNYMHRIATSTVDHVRYHLHGHYKCGTEKLPKSLDVEFLKKNLLTYRHKGIRHEVHAELGLTDTVLDAFIKTLSINVLAKSYDEQHSDIVKLLTRAISGSNTEDVALLYYPAAINIVRSLAIKSEVSERKITKTDFIQAVNRKEPIFAAWLQQKFGADYYAKMLRRKYFRFPQKVPKMTRIFIIDVDPEAQTTNLAPILQRIAQRFSHLEHSRTPQQDRFCPYVLLRGMTEEDVADVKQQLFDRGLNIIDGHAFSGSTFSAERLAGIAPTKDHLIQLKFIASVDQLSAVIALLSGATDVFDFYLSAPVQRTLIPSPAVHHEIKIPSPDFIREVIFQ